MWTDAVCTTVGHGILALPLGCRARRHASEGETYGRLQLL